MFQSSTKTSRNQGSGMSEEGRNLIRKLERDQTQITPRIWRTVSNAPNEFMIARVWFVVSVPLTENVSAVTSWAALFNWWSLYTWKDGGITRWELNDAFSWTGEHHVTLKCLSIHIKHKYAIAWLVENWNEQEQSRESSSSSQEPRSNDCKQPGPSFLVYIIEPSLEKLDAPIP